MATQDPFERAAKREQLEEVRRAKMTQRVRKEGSEGAGKAFRVFLLPWAIWGALRATDHSWGPEWPKAVVQFFFQTGFWFAALTVLVLVLLWVWMIGGDDDD